MRFDIDTCPLQLGVKLILSRCVAALNLSEIIVPQSAVDAWGASPGSPKQSCCGQRFHRVAQDLEVVCGMDNLDT